MTTLRPLAEMGPAAVTVAIEGDNEWRIGCLARDVQNQFDKQKVPMPGRFKGQPVRVDLTGHTVSALVLLHKGLRRLEKSAKKDTLVLRFAYEGEAAEFDLDTLMKEPTPAEDHMVLGKVRKNANLSAAQWQRAFSLLGLNAEAVKNGRKLVGFRMTVPGLDEAVYEINYNSIRPDRRAEEDEIERYNAARKWMAAKASEMLGLDNPLDSNGLPARARDFRTDLTIRTCPCCFRDIKASEHTNGRMADHGFRISGRDFRNYGGYRSGSCAGTDELPWEKSPEATVEKVLHPLEVQSEQTAAYLARLKTGAVESLMVEQYDYNTRGYKWVALTPADGRKWERALERETGKVDRALRAMWDGKFDSIPWYRMAVRTWQPHPDNKPAIGAPTGQPEEQDFAGKPEILG